VTALRALELAADEATGGDTVSDEAAPRDLERCTITVRAGLDDPRLPHDHRLLRVKEAALKEALGDLAPYAFPDDDARRAAHTYAAFSDSLLGLSRARLFMRSSEEVQVAMQKRASDALLVEAYFIEKAGLAYGAKMVLASETVDERSLYALFAADEARHLALVAPWLTEEQTTTTTNPFHALLARVIEEGDRSALVFLIQVVLEGWGLVHYRSLVTGAASPSLRTSLTAILRDETRHHGSGQVLLRERGLSPSARAFCEDVLAAMLQMVRTGPSSVVDAAERACGGLTRDQKRTLLTDLDGPGHAAARLTTLHKLLDSPDARAITERLAARGLFMPLSVDDALDVMGA